MRFVHYTQITPQSSPDSYKQGQNQAGHSIKRFHLLCAAATQKFTIVYPPNRGVPFAREEIDFSAYTNYPLNRISGVKIHVSLEDRSLNPQDVLPYVDFLRRHSWKNREGGILYCIGHPREFWNLIMHYYASPEPKTTYIEEWDVILRRLKQEGLKAEIVPCMYFARDSGCLDPRCPFLHDKDACVKERDGTLEYRRQKLANITTRDSLLWHFKEQDKFFSRHPPSLQREHTNGKKIPEIDRLWELPNQMAHICANPKCLAVQWATVPDGWSQVDLKKCSRCAVTYYCSAKCQNNDWKRHKTEPCVPYEDLVNNDSYWNSFGIRKGTGNPYITIENEDA